MYNRNKVITRVAAAILTAAALSTADTVVLRDGGTVENAVVVEIGARNIKYKVAGRDVLYSINKRDAEKVVYADSTEDVFDAPESAHPERRSGERPDKFRQRDGRKPPRDRDAMLLDAEMAADADSATVDGLDSTESAHPGRRAAVGRPDKFRPRDGQKPPFDRDGKRKPPRDRDRRDRREQPFVYDNRGAAFVPVVYLPAELSYPQAHRPQRHAGPPPLHDAQRPKGLKAVSVEAMAAVGGVDARANSDSVSYGYAISVGAALKIPISAAAAIRPEISLSYRTPMIMRSGDWDTGPDAGRELLRASTKSVSEFTAGLRITAQGSPSHRSRLFFEVGGALDIPFGVSDDDASLDYAALRSDVDYGIVYGAGIRLARGVSITARHTVFLNSYLKADNRNFSIFDVGANVRICSGSRKGKK